MLGSKKNELLEHLRSGKLDIVLNELYEYYQMNNFDQIVIQRLLNDFKLADSYNGVDKWKALEKVASGAINIISNLEQFEDLKVASFEEGVSDNVDLICDVIVETYNEAEFNALTIRNVGRSFQFENNRKLGVSFNSAIPDYISFLARKGKIVQFLLVLHENNPEDKVLNRLLIEKQISFKIYDHTSNLFSTKKLTSLEKIVNSGKYLSIEELLLNFSKLKRCVCKLIVPLSNGQNSVGTGVLIGKDLILTNFHVVESAIQKSEDQNKIVAIFDYEEDANKTFTYSGNKYNVKNILAASKPAVGDEFPPATDAFFEMEFPNECLDFALLKLENSISDKGYGIDPNNNRSIRGFVKLSKPADPQDFEGGSIFILQHPSGNPLVMALGNDKVIGTSKDRSRLRYEVNTMPGSSGSPIFNFDYELIAIHNTGENNTIHPTFNQGVRIEKILEYFQNNLPDLFNQEVG